jgi:hypothetical protein
LDRNFSNPSHPRSALPAAALITAIAATGFAALAGHWQVAVASLAIGALGFFGVLVAASR